MKQIREYHVEYYWAEQIAKRERRAALKGKLTDLLIFTAFIATWGVMVFAICNMVYGA